MNHPTENFVSQRQAADHLDISVRTLERWRVEPPEGGGPKYYKLGKRVVFRLSDLSNWAEKRAFGSTSEADPTKQSAA